MDLPWVHITWNCLYRNGAPPQTRKCVGSFWWRDIMMLSQDFFMIASCQANQGDTVMFWNDYGDLVCWNGDSHTCFLLLPGRKFRLSSSFKTIYMRIPVTLYQYRLCISLLNYKLWLTLGSLIMHHMIFGAIFGEMPCSPPNKHISSWVVPCLLLLFLSGYGRLRYFPNTSSSFGSC